MKSDYLKYKVNHPFGGTHGERKFADYYTAIEYALTVNGQVISLANDEIVWPVTEDVIVANYVRAQWLMFTAHKSGNHATMAITKANPYYVA